MVNFLMNLFIGKISELTRILDDSDRYCFEFYFYFYWHLLTIIFEI